MNITTTNILDSNLINNDNDTKILLANDLIEHFAPLFYEDTRKKQGQFSSNMTDITKLKNIISKYRNHLLKLNTSIEQESLKNKILKEIEGLSNTGVVYGSTKNTITEIIYSLDKQSLDELKEKLVLLQKIINEKRIKQ